MASPFDRVLVLLFDGVQLVYGFERVVSSLFFGVFDNVFACLCLRYCRRVMVLLRTDFQAAGVRLGGARGR